MTKLTTGTQNPWRNRGRHAERKQTVGIVTAPTIKRDEGMAIASSLA